MWDAWLELLRSGLDAIQAFTGFSWAWSIILFTAAVRVLIMPITVKQTRSMLTMQVVQPHIKQIQDRYKNDRQALQAKLMEFYRDNGINPFASCLPLLLQIPIMIGLFFVLRDFSKHVGEEGADPVYLAMQERAPLDFFFGLVPDITQNIDTLGWVGAAFVAFYVASQLVSTWVMSSAAQGQQRYIMLALPFIFILFIIRFPFGLLLFWIVTNLWTFGQHLVVAAITDTDREIVLPADKKGRKRVLKKKRDGGGEEVRQAEVQEADDDTSNSGSGETAPPADGNLRPNKRRRR